MIKSVEQRSQPVQKISIFYETQGLITMFTRVRHLPHESRPHFPSCFTFFKLCCISIIILSTIFWENR